MLCGTTLRVNTWGGVMFALINQCRIRISFLVYFFEAGTGMNGEVRVEMVMVLDGLWREKNGTCTKYLGWFAHGAVSVRIWGGSTSKLTLLSNRLWGHLLNLLLISRSWLIFFIWMRSLSFLTHHHDLLVVIKGKNGCIFTVHLSISLKILAWGRDKVLLFADIQQLIVSLI